MKIQKKLLIRFLAIFVLWTGGMNVCMAQSPCGDCGCDASAGEQCFCDMMDANGYFSITPICLSPNPVLPGQSYCVLPGTGMILDSNSLGGCQGEMWYASLLPLSDASFLFIFLLGVYGFTIYYRKKKYRPAL